ncbi:DUF7093 family protein [Natronorubrum sulfidifaciens]|uniref:Uncharacterized protein n=1 Tax=Natronorubrum sulfidifaciens JCM 14089 TaxID=1230460 RepID=L9W760_9EURY|nr:hypothetical protein [Natronorubrum sulfidifaciens]ELY45081.1 hypothetical protein C495_09070 [Natronorubrum sulfidifaciens JCM 14089]
MVLRCSLLGHDYGEADVEREREERGSEVVVTVQEYEECVRCGERNVISENTEITSLSMEAAADSRATEEEPEPDTTADAVETPPDVAPEADASTELHDDEDDAEFIDADADADAEFIDADSDVDDETDPEAPPANTAADDEDALEIPTDEHGEPVTDDGEILSDDTESQPTRDREHGEWPDSEDVGPPLGAENEPAGWPDDEPEHTAADAATETDAERLDADVTDDGIVLENDSGSDSGPLGESAAAADARTVTTEPPTADTQSDADAEAGTETDAGSGIERAGSAPVPGESNTTQDAGPTELYCPRCEYVAADNRTSLRTGDICPDCRKGYLGNRERQYGDR